MFPPSPDFVPANVRPYHVSTAGFAPYNFFFRYDMFGKLDATSCALAAVRVRLAGALGDRLSHLRACLRAVPEHDPGALPFRSADLARVARCPAAPSNAHAARAELCA
jgi:hypothetical protein